MYESLQHGYMTEEKFVLKCLENNIQISRTIFNVESYDFVVKTKDGFKSVQVKKSWIDERNRNVVNIRCSGRNKNRTYVNPKSADFLAVLIEEGDWFIIPSTFFEGAVNKLVISKKGKYSSFKDNWEFRTIV